MRIPDFSRDDLGLLHTAALFYQQRLERESEEAERSIELAELEERLAEVAEVLAMIERALDEPPFDWAA